MPLQNFYIECRIDGHKHEFTGEPKTKDGGFNLVIYQRSNGKHIRALDVVGYVKANGKLGLELSTPESRFPLNSTNR